MKDQKPTVRTSEYGNYKVTVHGRSDERDELIRSEEAKIVAKREREAAERKEGHSR